ncbi:hypothetical protein FH972_011097 [Carpinus fangiana]|uniref:DUF4219 domain-containing protein n=1 Tax=Carpinus fangiana TaxID=176857 RepID=A0A660KQ78_9ROSI|nr:hypothetical protein FH972_011097 [Carpinus fangiana]
MEVKDSLSTPVLENLYGSDNYVDWSIQVQTYLMAKDLWDTIEATTEPPKQEDNEAAFKAWSDKNYMALRVIKDSCMPSTSFVIKETSYAKDAWNTLAEKLNMEVKDSLSTPVLENLYGSDNYVDWSIQVQTYLMAKDLWDTIEATTEPPKQEDNEAAFKAWSDKNYMALRVIKDSCMPSTSFVIKETNVLQVLNKDNYEDRSVQVRDYLITHNLWDIVEETNKPPRQQYDEDDATVFHAWNKKNSIALQVIKNSCTLDTLFEIWEISSAKVAWNTLAEEYLPKNTSSDVLHVFNDDNYANWSVQVKDHLMAHDLWDIVEKTNKPQEDDKAACKAWSKKNFMALHVIQMSCGRNSFSIIKKISTAKTAWDTLAEWNRINVDREAFRKVAQNWDQINVIDHEAFKEEFEEVVGRGDWNAVNEFMNCHPGSVGLKITNSGDTALHVAVDAGHGHIVEKLVAIMSEQELEITNNEGNTALINAIDEENYRMAKCMLGKNMNLVRIKNSSSQLPVVDALISGHKKLARYLYSLTPEEDLKAENGCNGATLCTWAICTRTLDIAWDLIERCPRLALEKDNYDTNPLYFLVSSSFAFPRIKDKDLYDMKLIHVQANELLRIMCKQFSNSKNQDWRESKGSDAIFYAIENGILKFVDKIAKESPQVLVHKHSGDERFPNVLWAAIFHRQAEIFSLICGVVGYKKLTYGRDKQGNTILQMAGKLPPSTLVNRTAGAAFQMQRELQWFKVPFLTLYTFT